jgi:tetratricopeptide (TPR) repeat protein
VIPRSVVRRLRSADAPLLWTVVAALTRVLAAITRRPGPTARYAGTLERRGRPRAASTAYLEAAEHPRGQVAWAERAAALATEEGDRDQALRALRRAAALEPARATRHHEVARAAARCGRHEEAIAAYRAAIDRDGTYPAWRLRLARLLIKAGELEEASTELRRAVEQDGANAEAHHLLGRTLARLERHDEAAAALGEAVASAPSAARYHDLGTALERVLQPGVTRDRILGLRPGRQPDWAAVARSFAAAAALEPEAGRHHHREGLARLQQADLSGAVDALRRAVAREPTEAPWHYQLGVAILQLGGQRALTAEERREAAGAFARTLELDPEHRSARKRLVDAHVTETAWAEGGRVAWPDRHDATPEADELARLLAGEPLDAAIAAALAGVTVTAMGAIPDAWWRTVHARLLSLGRFTDAYRIARSLAERQLVQAPDPAPGAVSTRLQNARALGYLGRHDEAVTLLEVAADHAPSTRWRDVATKVVADLRLLAGDPTAHQERPIPVAGNDPEAEARFRDRIEGRRVAIVGPAVPVAERGAAIDAADTVVRTRHLPPEQAAEQAALVGTRTDIAYFASTSTGLFGPEIRQALRSGDLGSAVFRTSTYVPGVTHLEAPGDLRYVPSEFKAGFHGGPMAILRIVYDTLRYRPASLEVHNIDFFLSTTEYAPGYDIGGRAEQRWQELGALAARALAHDYLSDFTLTRTLHRAGVIDADPAVAELLLQTPEQYLRAMDASRGVPEGVDD